VTKARRRSDEPEATDLARPWREPGDDEGAKAIGTNLKQLTSLDLGGNQVSDEGAKAIATNLTELRELGLASNKEIRSVGGDVQAGVVAQARHFRHGRDRPLALETLARSRNASPMAALLASIRHQR